MTVVCVIASGASLTDEDVAYVHQKKNAGEIHHVIAVSNVGLDKAPWADALVSHDSAWWYTHPQALDFAGRRISRRGFRDTEAYVPPMATGINSGLMGMFVARDLFGADKILLLGFDMHGTHYFGKHTAVFNGRPLRNTTVDRFRQHMLQFARFAGADVVNCTPNTSLTRYPMMSIKEAI